MRRLVIILLLMPLSAMAGGRVWVSTAGSDGNSGADSNNTITLQHALTSAHASAGDTIYIRAGRYWGTDTEPAWGPVSLLGTALAPIVIRNWNQERVIIGTKDQRTDIGFTTNSGYTWFWGVELADSSDTTGQTGGGSSLWIPQGTGHRLINCVLHDAMTNAVQAYKQAVQCEVYGNIIFGSGRGDDRGGGAHGYAMYLQTDSTTPPRVFKDNIMFNNIGKNYNVTISGSSAAIGDSVQFIGNTMVGGHAYGGLLIGEGFPHAPRGFICDSNFYYRNTQSVFGNAPFWNNAAFIENQGIDKPTYRANVTAYGGWDGSAATDLPRVFQNNTIWGDIDATLEADTGNYTGQGNRYFLTDNGFVAPATKPTGISMRLSKNAYEDGRANLTLINWGDTTQPVSISLASAVPVGAVYTIRDAQNYYGQGDTVWPVIATGTYAGGNISFTPPIAPFRLPRTGRVDEVGGLPEGAHNDRELFIGLVTWTTTASPPPGTSTRKMIFRRKPS